MRLGLLTNLKEHDVPFLARHGFGSFELLCWPGDPFAPGVATDAAVKTLQAQMAEHDVELSCVGYYPNHLTEPDAPEHFLGVMKLARQLGLDTVSTFTGREPEKTIEDNIPAVQQYWREVGKRAADLGLRIAFENCPMFHCHPFRGTNIAFTPHAWELIFDALDDDPTFGLEWDPSHLICLLIEPTPTIRQFASKIYHVHAKDAEVRWDVVREQGVFDPSAVRHRMPGLGQVDWRAVISTLIEVGYRGNLDIEGAHDAVYGGELETPGLLIGLETLRRYVPQS